MSVANITDNLPEVLTKKLGPFPTWVWVGGVGGGLAIMLLRRNDDIEGTRSGDGSSDIDYAYQTPVGGPTFPGFSDAGGTTAVITNTVTETVETKGKVPQCPRGYKPVWNEKKKKYACQRVNKPSSAKIARKRKKGLRLAWDWNEKKWVWKSGNSFRADEPHLAFIEGPNGGPPEMTEQQLPAIAIAPVDKGPKPELVPAGRAEGQTELPYIAGKVPPRPMERTPGRPFYGS